MPPTFEASRRDLIEHNFSSPAFHDQARQAGVNHQRMGAAWAYLLDQAEIGMMCALGTGGDMVVRLADEFAPPDISATGCGSSSPPVSSPARPRRC